MPTQLHSTSVSAASATTVESRLTESRTTCANSVLMVLAGGWATFWSRPASTWPLSRSATIQVCAGPSGIGIEPTGCVLSAHAGETVAVQVPNASRAAAVAVSFRMAAKSNFRPVPTWLVPARWLDGRGNRPGRGAGGRGRGGVGAQEAAGALRAEHLGGPPVEEHRLPGDEHGADGVVVAVHHARQSAVLLDLLLRIGVERAVQTCGVD